MGVRHGLRLVARERKAHEREIGIPCIHLDVAIPQPVAVLIVVVDLVADGGEGNERPVRQFVEGELGADRDRVGEMLGQRHRLRWRRGG